MVDWAYRGPAPPSFGALAAANTSRESRSMVADFGRFGPAAFGLVRAPAVAKRLVFGPAPRCDP